MLILCIFRGLVFHHRSLRVLKMILSGKLFKKTAIVWRQFKQISTGFNVSYCLGLYLWIRTSYHSPLISPFWNSLKLMGKTLIMRHWPDADWYNKIVLIASNTTFGVQGFEVSCVMVRQPQSYTLYAYAALFRSLPWIHMINWCVLVGKFSYLFRWSMWCWSPQLWYCYN